VEERVEGFRDEIILPDGNTVKVGPFDRFDAVCSLLDSEERAEPHWLAEAVLTALDAKGGDIPEDAEDFIRVVNMCLQG
jgi:hypothetical protein